MPAAVAICATARHMAASLLHRHCASAPGSATTTGNTFRSLWCASELLRAHWNLRKNGKETKMRTIRRQYNLSRALIAQFIEK